MNLTVPRFLCATKSEIWFAKEPGLLNKIYKLKWQMADHVARRNGGRWVWKVRRSNGDRELISYLVCIANFIMDKNIEQRVCLKFCIANGISYSESLKMIQKAYGESTLSKTRAYEWYKAFKSGRDVMEDLPRSGRPSTSATEVNIAKVKKIVTENTHSTLREIATELSF
uniref:SFRICE_031170 n=1 Tax=Spodoptera frugiperda TaxID=7108 RepID=A0A2H1WM79_SPOFR